MPTNEFEPSLRKYLQGRGDIPDAAMPIVEKLIRATIAYRDAWMRDHADILTVEETREAIDILLAFLREGCFPEENRPKIDGLVELWLKELGQ